MQRVYANHYRARDEYYMLSLLLAAIDDVCAVSEASAILHDVTYVTKLLSAYTRRGPNRVYPFSNPNPNAGPSLRTKPSPQPYP